MGHLGESHLDPFRKSFIFSRRQSLQSAPVYRAICRFTPQTRRRFGGRQPLCRNRGYVLNGSHLKAGRLQRPDGGLASRARALDENGRPCAARAPWHGARQSSAASARRTASIYVTP